MNKPSAVATYPLYFGPLVLVLARGRGRDFVLADVHGMLHLVHVFLAQVDFDPEVDRLFIVGDLTDRGPYSDEVLELLRMPWCIVVRGNHEQCFLDIYQGGRLDAAALDFHVRRNGGAWWLDLSEARRQEHLDAYARMPLAIEVATARGTVGIVHAEVPRGMDWPTFKAQLLAGDHHTMQSALWGRTRVKAGDESGVLGIGRIFCGHTIVDSVTRLANCYMLDTGAFMRLAGHDRQLTAANLLTQSRILVAPRAAKGETNIFDSEGDGPFGLYARQ
jgi:serine/threonine protein phosphatase 1